MSELAVVDETGDTKYMWDIENEDEVTIAKETFDKFKAINYIAYTVGKNGHKGDVINKFDSELGRIIMVPPVVGG